MAVHQFHRIGSGEWQATSQHLVKRHAEGVEVAPRIDRAIHSPGLFGSHVGQCSGDEPGRFRRLALARQARSDAETHEPHLASRMVDQHIGRFDVLVDQAAPVYLAERSRQADGQR